jgi:hypothetical protein
MNLVPDWGEAISEDDARATLRRAGMPGDRIERLVRFYRVVGEGRAAVCSTHLRDVIGRPAIRFAVFVRDHREAWS